MSYAHGFSSVHRIIIRNCKIVEECGGKRNRRLVAFEHFTTQTARARGYWRRPSRDYIVYPCWQTIKDASECTFMSFLHLVWSITQPEWSGRLEMHKNSFHEFHINNAYLTKICCNKSQVCSMEQHFSPCALQDSSSAWSQHAEDNSSKHYEGHIWNLRKLSHIQHPYSSSADDNYPTNEMTSSLDHGNAMERDKRCKLSTSCFSSKKYPWMRETHTPINFSSINVMESGERTRFWNKWGILICIA